MLALEFLFRIPFLVYLYIRNVHPFFYVTRKFVKPYRRVLSMSQKFHIIRHCRNSDRHLWQNISTLVNP
jgi:hypothetical protein